MLLLVMELTPVGCLGGGYLGVQQLVHDPPVFLQSHGRSAGGDAWAWAAICGATMVTIDEDGALGVRTTKVRTIVDGDKLQIFYRITNNITSYACTCAWRRSSSLWSSLAETLDMDLFGLSELATVQTLGDRSTLLLDLDQRSRLMVTSGRTVPCARKEKRGPTTENDEHRASGN